MRRRTSPFEDFVDLMSMVPWWVNVILAVISYIVLHSIAMTFYDPAPKVEIGQLGQYAADKMKGSLALFGQFVVPFGFLLAGLGGLIKKHKRTGKYKELVLYVIIGILFFGSIISKEGGIQNAMQKSIQNDKVPIVTNSQIQEDKQSSEDETRQKSLQGVNTNTQAKQGVQNKNERIVIYSWTDEKGQKVFSNKGFPENKPYYDGKIEWK